MYAFFTAEDCFLVKKEWRDVWASRGHAPYDELVDRFWFCLALCPSVVRQAQILRKMSRSSISVDQEAIDAVTRQTLELRERFVDWYTMLTKYLPPPNEVPSQDSRFPYSTMFIFPSVWVGTLFMGYWSSMLLIQQILGEWTDVEFEESNSELLEKLFKSVEFTSKGFMGPYRVGYAMRISLEFANEEQKEWIRRLLSELSDGFAATSPTPGPGLPKPIIREIPIR